MPVGIGPSVLASDMSKLADEAQELAKHFSDHDYLHLDVMDGHFVPNLTFGAPVIKVSNSDALQCSVATYQVTLCALLVVRQGLRKHTKACLDAHLMVSNPAQWVDDMADAGVDRFTFHVEATDKHKELINAVKAKGMKVGIALKPGTPVDAVLPFCELLVSKQVRCCV